MADDPELREARLTLLAALKSMILRVADIGELAAEDVR
jgi:glycyl-tRNA synthetase beta subunit